MSCNACDERMERFVEWFMTLVRRRKNPDQPTADETAEETRLMAEREIPT